MGMGFGANFAEVVEPETLRKLVPKEYADLDKAIKYSSHACLDGVAQAIQAGDMSKKNKGDKAILKAIKGVQAAFAAKFPGLSLELGYHDADNDGDCYDDLSGAYWHVDGLYVLSNGAKKLGKKNWERKFFVTLG